MSDEVKPVTDEQYLLNAGWRRMPAKDCHRPDLCWIDPRSKEPEHQRVVGTRKLPSGKVETLTQTVVPPAAWGYSLAEALEIQRAIDAKK